MASMDENRKKIEKAAAELIGRILNLGLNGAGPFKGSVGIAEESLKHSGGDPEAAIERLIKVHVRLVSVEGFATGLPGLLALPVTVSSDVTAFYVLAARMVGGIAHLRGYDVNSDDVRSAILVSLLGAGGVEVLKEFEIKVGQKGLAVALKRVPGKVFIEINKKVGFRLITKAGEKGMVNVGKIVPLVGGPIGAGTNFFGMRALARYAKSQFPPVGSASAESPAGLT